MYLRERVAEATHLEKELKKKWLPRRKEYYIHTKKVLIFFPLHVPQERVVQATRLKK